MLLLLKLFKLWLFFLREACVANRQYEDRLRDGWVRGKDGMVGGVVW